MSKTFTRWTVFYNGESVATFNLFNENEIDCMEGYTCDAVYEDQELKITNKEHQEVDYLLNFRGDSQILFNGSNWVTNTGLTCTQKYKNLSTLQKYDLEQLFNQWVEVAE